MDRDSRQIVGADWARAAFGDETMVMLDERGARVIEEAAELGQAVGVPEAIAHKIISYVYARPVGEPAQELGGVGLTLLVLAQCLGLSADGEERRELSRVLSKPLQHFAERHAAKRAHGITPGIRSDDQPEAKHEHEAV